MAEQLNEAAARNQNRNVNVTIYGSIQAGNLYIGDGSSIQGGARSEQRRKGRLDMLLKILRGVIAFIYKISVGR